MCWCVFAYSRRGIIDWKAAGWHLTPLGFIWISEKKVVPWKKPLLTGRINQIRATVVVLQLEETLHANQWIQKLVSQSHKTEGISNRHLRSDCHSPCWTQWFSHLLTWSSVEAEVQCVRRAAGAKRNHDVILSLTMFNWQLDSGWFGTLAWIEVWVSPWTWRGGLWRPLTFCLQFCPRSHWQTCSYCPSWTWKSLPPQHFPPPPGTNLRATTILCCFISSSQGGSSCCFQLFLSGSGGGEYRGRLTD